LLKPILRLNARNEIFGGSSPTRPAELLRKNIESGLLHKIWYAMFMTSERPKPYVGISGVISSEQQSFYGDIFRDCGLEDAGRRLALGIKAVHKTQFLDVENKYGRAWYPVGETAFRGAVEQSPDSQRMINIAQVYLDIEHVGDADYRNSFTKRIFHRGEEWLNGIQFDILPWHSDKDIAPFLEQLKESHPDQLVLLQCHGEAMGQLGPKEAIRQLGAVASSIDYVLFDASHGTGTRLDVAKLQSYLDEGYESDSLSNIGLAVAGGLNAAVIRDDLPELLSTYPQTSWDAEGQLHPINDKGERPLDEKVVRNYLNASRDVLVV
jgi:hypothetical protein